MLRCCKCLLPCGKAAVQQRQHKEEAVPLLLMYTVLLFDTHICCPAVLLYCAVLCCAVLCCVLLFCPAILLMCFVQALSAEVERRQSAVWAPQVDSTEATLTPQQRQQRVRTARTALAQALQQRRQGGVAAAAAAAAAAGRGGGAEGWGPAGGLSAGGFMADICEDGVGGDGWWEAGLFKRQRV